MWEILDALRSGETLDDRRIAQILDCHNKVAGEPNRKYAKKHLVPYYLDVKAHDPKRWESWQVDASLETQLLTALRMKPRRTASGVATITVITKPWPCANNCLYCPNDVRMPKSYLHDEPACQRAERNCFDPYLQVASRLRALVNMGHITDKVELIILGGTWADYPRDYQIWFVEQLFAALNDADDVREANVAARWKQYQNAGVNSDPSAEHDVKHWQDEVDSGSTTYNQAVHALYGERAAWQDVSRWQTATLESLLYQHRINEAAEHRVVGLVVETRPDTVSVESLLLIRQLGATKLQMGIQSLDANVLAANRRSRGTGSVIRALNLARLFGFKVHTHFMVNLLGTTPERDKAEYARFVSETPYQPDEVKIYPCALVEGTGLISCFEDGSWQPYSEDELLDVLVADTLTTPAFTRISRMIRDISAGDIVAGNKKGNLRQLVEDAAAKTGKPIHEMRHRELAGTDVDLETLTLRELSYETLSTREVFLEWVTPEDRIAGFLRLSLPNPAVISAHPELPVRPGQAMIREVHVYGRVAGLGNADADSNAQHTGLGKRLVERACHIAAAQGYREINVISAVGTRAYYRNLGFCDAGLYQVKPLA